MSEIPDLPNRVTPEAIAQSQNVHPETIKRQIRPNPAAFGAVKYGSVWRIDPKQYNAALLLSHTKKKG